MIQFRSNPIQVDLSKLITQSVIVDVSDPNSNGSITSINVNASGISNFNTNPINLNVQSRNSTFTINFTPNRGEAPVFK